MKKRNHWKNIIAWSLSAALLLTAFPADTAYGEELDTAGESGFSMGSAALSENEAGKPEEDTIRLLLAQDGEDLRTYASEAPWRMGITNMESKAQLSTVQITTGYNGERVETPYLNMPRSGYQYVIVSLNISKQQTGGPAFQAQSMTLEINGNSYPRILADSFLTNHNYASFSTTEVLAGSRSGDIVFEVRNADASPISSWVQGMKKGTIGLRAGDIAGEPEEQNDSERTEVMPNMYQTGAQYQREQQILKDYSSRKDSYSITKPYFIRDPYETAPLAGLAMFETDQAAASIQVTVKGKASPRGDFTYDVPSSGKSHQVPVIGLYPGYANVITLTAKDESGAVLADSGELRLSGANTSGIGAGISTNKVQTAVSGKSMKGFTVLVDGRMTVIDEDGDVRWYTTIGHWAAGANEITDRGTIYFTVSPGSNNPNGMTMEMNWMGKVIAQYMSDDRTNMDGHHDLTESTDEQSFFVEFNVDKMNIGIREIDRSTGAELSRFFPKDIFEDHTNLEAGIRTTKQDWSHWNTIEKTDMDDVYLYNFRNQHMVFKYDYKNRKVLWAFTPTYAHQESKNSEFRNKTVQLQNVGETDANGEPIQWFYSAHDSNLLPDLDGNPKTDDVLLYDNGVFRSLTSTTANPRYSRIVHYRINTEDRTATQIFAWGGKDKSVYGDVCGAAQYFPETNSYLMTTNVNYSSNGDIIELDSKGNIVYRIKTSGSFVYRGYRVPFSQLPAGFTRLGEEPGKAFVNIDSEVDFSVVQADTTPSVSITAGLTAVQYYGTQMRVKGQAYVQSGKNRSVYLIADDGQTQYGAVLLQNSTANAFNNTPLAQRPISLENLPAGRYNLGLLVAEDGVRSYKPTAYYIEKKGAMTISLTDDAAQQEIVEELIAKSKDQENTLAKPVVAVNPFGKAPLSAIAAFYTPKATTVHVTVKGKPASGDFVNADVSYEISDVSTHNHVVPIVGLYENYENEVVLETEDGKTATVRIQTGEVNPALVRDAVVAARAADKAQTLPGLTFMTPAGAQTVPYAVDVNGDLRWAYLCAAAAPLETKPLRDGHFLVPSDKGSTQVFTTDAETALEIDLVGRVYAEYYLDGQPHHDVWERENGNLIFALSRRNSTSIEDYMVEVDRETGREIHKWDFRKIMGIPEYDPSYDPAAGGTDDPNAPHRANPAITLSSGGQPYADWFHQNALTYVEGDPSDLSDDAIIACSRHQSMIVKINAMKAEGENPSKDAVDWIYTDPSWLPQSSLDLKTLILKPESANPIVALKMSEPGSAAPEEPEKTTLPAVLEEAVAEPEIKSLQETESTRSPALEETTSSALKEKGSSVPEELSLQKPGELDLTKPEGTTDSAEAATPGMEEYPYIYGPHAIDILSNGDYIVYDNHLYGSKTETRPASELFSRAVRFRVNETDKTFKLIWEYGREQGAETYTPFIGDVDYLGDASMPGQGENNHYLINFGGITRNKADQPGELVESMLSGSISARVEEYRDGKIIWEANIKGEKGTESKIASVYRAERVDLGNIPVSALDYKEYAAVENRGMYLNTPQSDQVDNAVLTGALNGIQPVEWMSLQDEGNRLMGKFYLPGAESNVKKKTPGGAAETTGVKGRTEKVYVVLELLDENGGTRIYEADQISASPALGVERGYYAFEITKDNKPFRIKILTKRSDGSYILGNTGEVATATMEYATGQLPVIDPLPISAQGQALPMFGAANKQLLEVAAGSLEPGMKYVYLGGNGLASDLLYSPLRGSYVRVIDGTATDLTSGVKAVSGTVSDLREGIVGQNRYTPVQGALRTKLELSDLFYLSNSLLLPAGPDLTDEERAAAMDVNGDGAITGADLAQLINGYVFKQPFALDR